MDKRIMYRLAAALLCLAGPLLYNAFNMPVYVYFLSLIGFIALIQLDRGKNKRNKK